MVLRYKGRLLDHLGHKTYTPARVEDIARDLGVEDVPGFRAAVEALEEEGLVEIGPTGLVTLPSMGASGGEVVGTFKRNPKGFGFIRPDVVTREGDLYVPPDGVADALTGDRVRAIVRRDRKRAGFGAAQRSPYVGFITEILERKRTSFSGTIERRGQQWLALPDGRDLHGPVVLRDAASKNVKAGDKVQFELLEHASNGTLAEGVVVRVLGDAGRPDVETQAIIAAFGLPEEFPEACLAQAREATHRFEEEVAAFERGGPAALRDRLDLTNDFIITIDPPDARDFDDAISIVRTDRGWDLSVHIADVAHFIGPGTPLDGEARQRGNSVYLPRHVIPMLPEVLSNGICSLQEGVPRFTKSAFMSYDRDGNLLRQGVDATLIRSAKRLTYLEAQALIDGNEAEARRHAKTEPDYTPRLVETLREMDALARAIRARRQRQGMISLELPEVVLIFDDEGRVIDAEREDDAFTHTLIEMFMVEANEVLARLFENLGVPLLRRVHPEPTPGDVDELRRAARVAGYTIPANPTREQLQGLLDATRGTPAARAVHMAVLRTLTRAEYSPALIGHFALASESYAHFTSPIRRYADLTVHRALSEYLRLTANGRQRPTTERERRELGRRLRESPLCPDEQTLLEIGRHISMTEDNAEEAEDQLRGFLVLQLLEKHVGEAFSGVVTGVSPRGVFVQLDKFLIDGLIKTADLPGDVTRSNAPPFWKIDPRTGALVDQRSGRSFSMGDAVRVRIANVDLARRQLDLVVDDPASRAAGKARKVAAPTAGGMGGAAGKFKSLDFGRIGQTGAQRRSRKSKARDKGKKDYRRNRGR